LGPTNVGVHKDTPKPSYATAVLILALTKLDLRSGVAYGILL